MSRCRAVCQVGGRPGSRRRPPYARGRPPSKGKTWPTGTSSTLACGTCSQSCAPRSRRRRSCPPLPMLHAGPRGDGHHVIAIPPFGAGDAFTTVLRRYLGRLGYHVHPWGRQEILALHRLSTVAVKRLDELAAGAGGRVSLIGHSLGGIYAREVARAAPVARAAGDHGRQPVRGRPEGERRLADVRVGHRHPHQEHPARGHGPAQRAAPRAVDGDLQPDGRRRRLAVVHRRRGRHGRERRGAGQPRRAAAQPRRVLRDRRSPRPARGLDAARSSLPGGSACSPSRVPDREQAT